MLPAKFVKSLCFGITAAGCSILFMTTAADAATKQGYDYSHRKRDCEITVTQGGQAVADAAIELKQLRNHFGFGGTIRYWAFDTIGEIYGERFQSYFDIATPENEMKWEYIQKSATKVESDHHKGDFLTDWCLERDIAVRGHNLFWNEKEAWLPEWTRNLGTADFKAAMQERIDDAMNHYKGKVIQWDVINEICHGDNGSTPATGMLESKSGDPNVFSWILDEARAIDPDPEFVLNDYNLLNGNATDAYINKVKPLSGKFQVVGAEGHFGGSMDRNQYEQKINYLAQSVGKPVWITEFDFSLSVSQAPDKIEEIMRSCFANPNVEGLIMWVWCKKYMWRDNLTSYFIDSVGNEFPSGERYRQVRQEWKTNTDGTTDAGGTFSFNGFQGKYEVTVGDFVDTVYLEPGNGTKQIEIVLPTVGICDPKRSCRLTGLKRTMLTFNGTTVPIRLPKTVKTVYLSSFAINGKLLQRVPISLNKDIDLTQRLAAGCYLFKLEHRDQVIYTGKGVAFR